MLGYVCFAFLVAMHLLALFNEDYIKAKPTINITIAVIVLTIINIVYWV